MFRIPIRKLGELLLLLYLPYFLILFCKVTNSFLILQTFFKKITHPSRLAYFHSILLHSLVTALLKVASYNTRTNITPLDSVVTLLCFKSIAGLVPKSQSSQAYTYPIYTYQSITCLSFYVLLFLLQRYNLYFNLARINRNIFYKFYDTPRFSLLSYQKTSRKSLLYP